MDNQNINYQNEQGNNTKSYNLQQIYALSNGDINFVKKMVDLFVEYTPVAILQIKDALKAGDYITICKLAHKIKPSINSLNITSIQEEIKILSKLSNYNLTDVELELLILKVEKTIRNVLIELKTEKYDKIV